MLLIKMVVVDKNWLMSTLEEWNIAAAKNKLSLRLIAVGGTALTLLNLKASTKDIDFAVPGGDFTALSTLLKKVGAKAAGGISFRTKDGARLDIFGGGQIFTTTLPEDFLEQSTPIKYFGSIKLYALSIYDIIITKLARSSASDEEDIKAVFTSAEVDIDRLKRRHEKVQKLNYDRNLKYHFERLLNILLKEWRKA